MKMRKRIVLFFVLFLVVACIVLFATGVMQTQIAKFVASNYASSHYSDMGLTCQTVEYDKYFDSQIVTFQDKNGEPVTFWLFPSFFPVIVERDSLLPDPG